MVPMMSQGVTVIGGGLAGSEAAWQLAHAGVPVTLYEMRPHVQTGAHVSGRLAELVCSNSLRGASLENAVGLLKEEMGRLGSLIIEAARATSVPAGGALAVDRERFADYVQGKIAGQPLIDVRREEVRAIPDASLTIVACGPLASPAHVDERMFGDPTFDVV